MGIINLVQSVRSDVMANHSYSRPSIAWHLVLKVASGLALLTLLLSLWPSSSSSSSWASHHFSLSGTNRSSDPLARPASEIPNLVHYVWLVKNPDQPEVSFDLTHFLSIYSASIKLNPKKIYIHTDIRKDLIPTVFDPESKNPYMRALLRIPTVEVNYHMAPNQSTSGTPMPALANRGDFVRVDVLLKYGGVYMDTDVYVLRDLKPLRKAGFAAVMGRQDGGQICPATMLSVPGAQIIKEYAALQDEAFDGSWSMHAMILITWLVEEFANVDYQRLVLPKEALFPGKWDEPGLIEMYEYHFEDPPPPSISSDLKGIRKTLATFHADREKQDAKRWERDWRSAYTLHGWHHTLSGDANRAKKMFNNEEGTVTIDYILARRSNFGRLVYPIMKSALDTGALVREDGSHLSDGTEDHNSKQSS